MNLNRVIDGALVCARLAPRSGSFAAAVAAVLLLAPSGCRLTPEYARPVVETPPDWKWKIAEPRDGAPRGAWWSAFQDPALDELIGRAVTNNFDLQAAFHRVEQARAVARVDRAQFYPSLTAQPSWTRYRTSGNAPSPVPFPVPSFTQQQWSMPFDLSYEVDLWGKVRGSFESARHAAVGAAAAREFLALTVQADVAAAYFGVRTYDAEIGLLEQAIALRGEALGIFEQRQKAGIGDEFQVERARVEVASAEADLRRARLNRAQMQNGLAVLCGAVPSRFELPPGSDQMQLPEVAPGLPSALLERRPDVAQAERELAARLSEIGVAKAAFFPSLHLTASGGVLSGEVNDLFLWDSRTWGIGPAIQVPIFQGGRNRANLERAQARYEEAVAQYRQRILTAFREVEDTLASRTFLREEADARAAAAEAATKAAALSISRYQAGAINFLEVVDSENARLSNEIARLRVMNEQRLATVRLIKALGGGWQDAPGI